MDDFTREGLAIEGASSLPSTRVLVVLARLFQQHGTPAFLRSDNDPEFIAWAVRNGYGERFTGTVRNECLNMYAFSSVAPARVQREGYRRQYNKERLHSSLGYRTRAEFKVDCLRSQPDSPKF